MVGKASARGIAKRVIVTYKLMSVKVDYVS